MTEPIRVLIVDDHKVVRRGLKTFLSTYEDIEVVGDVGSGAAAVEQRGAVDPDVVLMDLQMPGMDGPEAIARLRDEQPDLKVVAVTSFDDEPLVRRAVDAGATGYLLKTADESEIVAAIRLAHQGRTVLAPEAMSALLEGPPSATVHLTDRERQILELLATGITNPQIAARLSISPSTVNFHVHNVLEKLSAKTRTEAVTIARNEGLLPD